ncbi:hypothetical protein EQG63_03010 [Flavobacterium amnicola]|uniref:Peptidase S74 domain-containing protein n=1 Tax=Flavobacterium amnicola TaxID=2506422 RepID=A0A4Q1K5P8_9FLAO|nr:tail fiber domain-containing protein [Flavobacterium amnicola]RXR20922.1 hypothetical protein EQG63_03010 [Flavobacterium amnicola]
MKKYILLLTFFTFGIVNAQIGIGTVTPNSSSILDVTSTTKGLLPPKMTQAQRTAIATPATGLLVFQTDGSAGYYFYNGAGWQQFSAGNSWSLNGNSGTVPATNKLGTTDNQPLLVKTNNAESFRILGNGNVVLGGTTSTSKLHLTSPNVLSIVQDFESVTSGNVTLVNTNNPYNFYTNVGCIVDDGWRISTSDASSAACASCSGQRAVIDYGASTCDQDATLVVKLGVINATSIPISFNYSFNYDVTPEAFVVTLYNETTASVQATLLNLSADALNQLYSSTQAITSGQDYSLRFRYVGNYGWGVTVDNISIVAPVNVLRIVDGNQANNYVMVSDANGNGTWTNPSGFSISDDDWRFNSGSAYTDPIYRTGDIRIGSSGTPSYELDVDQGIDGNQTGLGSSEYITDGSAENWISNTIVPQNDNSVSLGSASLRWSTIYATNGVINTSDSREKENIQPLHYGLQELKQLKPVSYQWKEEKYGKTILSDSEKRNKIGFIAQDLQKILPETVQDSEWRPKDPNNLSVYEKRKTNILGVSYSEILPVVIKATQENQNTLNEVKKLLDEATLMVKQLEKK